MHASSLMNEINTREYLVGKNSSLFCINVSTICGARVPGVSATCIFALAIHRRRCRGTAAT